MKLLFSSHLCSFIKALVGTSQTFRRTELEAYVTLAKKITQQVLDSRVKQKLASSTRNMSEGVRTENWPEEMGHGVEGKGNNQLPRKMYYCFCFLFVMLNKVNSNRSCLTTKTMIMVSMHGSMKYTKEDNQPTVT